MVQPGCARRHGGCTTSPQQAQLPRAVWRQCQFESQNDECTVSGTFRFLYLVQSAVPGIISDLTGNYFWPPPQTRLEPCTAAQIAAYTQQLGESSAAAEELVVGGQSRPEPR
jgi:hypothetical protein